MTVHRLKTDRPHYQDILDGRKPHEARLNDRHYSEGDTLQLVERDPKTGRLTGRTSEWTVTHHLPRAERWHPLSQIEQHGLSILTISPAHDAYAGSDQNPQLAAGEITPDRLAAAVRILRERFSLGYVDWPEDDRRRFYEQTALQILQLR